MGSMSVDDLVSSMSTSHIGQEAMDLQLLQVCGAPFIIIKHEKLIFF